MVLQHNGFCCVCLNLTTQNAQFHSCFSLLTGRQWCWKQYSRVANVLQGELIYVGLLHHPFDITSVSLCCLKELKTWEWSLLGAKFDLLLPAYQQPISMSPSTCNFGAIFVLTQSQKWAMGNNAFMFASHVWHLRWYANPLFFSTLCSFRHFKNLSTS